jgi:hypothetical protein
MVEDASSSAVGDAGEHITACENKSSEVVTITHGNRSSCAEESTLAVIADLSCKSRVE